MQVIESSEFNVPINKGILKTHLKCYFYVKSMFKLWILKKNVENTNYTSFKKLEN